MDANRVAVDPSPATAPSVAGAVASRAPAAGFGAILSAATASPRPRSITLGEMLGALATGPGLVGARPVPSAAALPGGPAGAPGTAGSALTLEAIVPGRLSSDFGMREHPITGAYKMHSGVDIAAPAGTPIRAAAPGVVTFAGNRGGYGLLVIVDHGAGVETRYAHQQRLDVRAGDRIVSGDVLGTVGATGMATGPHLHFEVRRDGAPVDPTAAAGGVPPWTT